MSCVACFVWGDNDVVGGMSDMVRIICVRALARLSAKAQSRAQ